MKSFELVSVIHKLIVFGNPSAFDPVSSGFLSTRYTQILPQEYMTYQNEKRMAIRIPCF